MTDNKPRGGWKVHAHWCIGFALGIKWRPWRRGMTPYITAHLGPLTITALRLTPRQKTHCDSCAAWTRELRKAIKRGAKAKKKTGEKKKVAGSREPVAGKKRQKKTATRKTT